MKCGVRGMLSGVKMKENYFFLVMVFAVLCFGMLGVVRSEKSTSDTENRALAKFEHFTLKKFFDGSFQDNFENALSDQFLGSEKIRVAYGQMEDSLPTFGIDDVVCMGRYRSLANDTVNKYAVYDCDDYILRAPFSLSEKQQKILQQNIAKFNMVNNKMDAYYYVINTSSSFDFENNEYVVDYAKILSEQMTGNYRIASLEYNNYDEYKKYFYKTDLHWNYVGSYQGFLDIAGLLRIKNPIAPEGFFTQGELFVGSEATAIQKYDFKDEFSIYTFGIPEHSVKINGEKKGRYNNLDAFINHDYEYKPILNYYVYFYGNNCGEIIFDFDQPEKENLLVVADSFSNAINELIAQYYNKTYVLDLRYYEKTMNKEFSLSQYLKGKDIDKVLFIISSEYFILKDNTTKGLEL